MKKRWIILGVVVILGAIGAIRAVNNGNSSHPQQGPSSPTASSVKSGQPVGNTVVPASDTNAATPADKGTKITRGMYDKIKTGDSDTGKGGMTLDQVEKILGKGHQTSESDADGHKYDDYKWNNTDGTDYGANVTIHFIDGHASGKEEVFMK
jgi:hypothetical protein